MVRLNLPCVIYLTVGSLSFPRGTQNHHNAHITVKHIFLDRQFLAKSSPEQPRTGSLMPRLILNTGSFCVRGEVLQAVLTSHASSAPAPASRQTSTRSGLKANTFTLFHTDPGHV